MDYVPGALVVLSLLALAIAQEVEKVNEDGDEEVTAVEAQFGMGSSMMGNPMMMGGMGGMGKHLKSSQFS